MDDDEFVADASPTADKNYSPEKFYTATRNAKGFPGAMRISVPPEVAAKVQAVIAKAVVPYYQTAADVHRDALVHRLHWLEGYLKDDAPVASEQIRELREMLVMESELSQYRSLQEAQQRVFDRAMNIIDTAEPHEYDEVASLIRKSIISLRNPQLKSQLSARLDRMLR